MHAPTTVFLRSGMKAEVTGQVRGCNPFVLEGVAADGVRELWREDGKWREDGRPHPRDMVSVVTTSGHQVPLC